MRKIISLLILILFLSSCAYNSNAYKKNIIGKWGSKNGFSIEFKQNGKAKVHNPKASHQKNQLYGNWKYEFIKDDTILIDSGITTYTIKILSMRDNKMKHIKIGNKKSKTWHRLK